MGRSNRRRRDERPLDIERALGGLTRSESHPDGEWMVRHVGAGDASRRFLCPGCQQMFGGIPHVVAWPADSFGGISGPGGLGDRRHWHTPCWRARNRRRPGGSIR